MYWGPDGTLLRQVNERCSADYRRLMESGLYDELSTAGLLVEHEEQSLNLRATDEGRHVLRPRRMPFVSYPYEWPFSALKQAALTTLEIQRRAIQYGMTLKDASGYNIQWDGTTPVFIDTLSFTEYEPGTPWTAYGQFCQHFLAPLALMSRTDIRLQKLLAEHVDGIPLDLASRLLPSRTRFSLGLGMHIHLHAKAVRRYESTDSSAPPRDASNGGKLSRTALEAMLDNLGNTIRKLDYRPQGTEWADYYEDNSYTSTAFEEKKHLVDAMLDELQPGTVWDLGANTGVFSRLASRRGAFTCAMDIDPACVEKNFRKCRADGEPNLLPLLLDLTNPSPAIGWAHTERDSLAGRGPCDSLMALALIHHLAISNNVPLSRVAEFFNSLCRNLIIEFVPKSDPQVRRLLASREDIFDDYTPAGFENAFADCFTILQRHEVGEEGRCLYLMRATDVD